MQMVDVIDEIKLELTGGLLDLEIEDSVIESTINKTLREVNRYWDETSFETIPFSSCIDLTDSKLDLKSKVNTIVKVYRTEGIGNVEKGGLTDPLYMQQFSIFSNAGTMYNLQDYLLNYAAWTTVGQIQNTMSTDMAFTMDKHNNRLYINNYLSKPNQVTVEYIPMLSNIEDIKSEYWIDVVLKMALAQTKIILGRIRTRFSQSNALWTQDGEKLLEEGTTDLKELREALRTNDNFVVYGVD